LKVKISSRPSYAAVTVIAASVTTNITASDKRGFIMARMSEAAKRRVPKSERGVPGKSGTGSYPMPDKAHARAAVGLAAMHHGANSAFTRKIKAKASKLGYGKKVHSGVTDVL
jgi:hypothetical protein